VKKDLKKIIQKSFLVFFILTFFILNSAQALMIKLSLHRLTIEADAIVLGEVENIRCEWSLDKQIILSVVTLRIHEILKGDFYNPEIFIQYPGGTLGDISLRVSDMPTFQSSEKVLVFLKSIADMANTKNSLIVTLNIFPAFEVFGNAQGKYFIDANGIAQKSGYNLFAKDDESDRALSLSVLRVKIRSILKQHSRERIRIHDKSKH